LQQALWGLTADPDGDGVANAGEAYLGRDPLQWERSPFSVFENNGVMTVRWQRSLSGRGVQPRVRTSSDLQTWITPIGFTITPRPDLITRMGYQNGEVQIPTTAGRRFFHLDFVTD